MAHNLDFSKGFAAFASRKEAAWHVLGSTVEAMSAKEALTLGGLDFDVIKLPNVHKIGNKEIISQNSFFTYRNDTEAVLGDKLGKDYTVIQNRESMDLIDTLVSSGVAEIETVGALFGGAWVFITCKVKASYSAGKDEINQYLIVSNSHDGSKAVEVYFSDVRVVCWNTLQLSLKGCTQIHRCRHTANVKDRVNEAFKIMNLVESNVRAKKEAFEKMQNTQFSEARFFDYIGNVFFTKDEIKAVKEGKKDAISTRKQNIITDISQFANTGIGQKEANPGSSWWAYNGLTGFYSNVKTYKNTENRMNSLLWGTDAELMEKGLELALEPSKIVSLAKDLTVNLNFN